MEDGKEDFTSFFTRAGGAKQPSLGPRKAEKGRRSQQAAGGKDGPHAPSAPRRPGQAGEKPPRAKATPNHAAATEVKRSAKAGHQQQPLPPKGKPSTVSRWAPEGQPQRPAAPAAPAGAGRAAAAPTGPTKRPRGEELVAQAEDAGAAAPPHKRQRLQPAGAGKGFWPFDVDYLDHFETDGRAVHDLQPVLAELSKRLSKRLADLVVYDPFFCKGGVRKHFTALGIQKFIHRNRDFYKDVEAGSVPEYDILVTNPPYSGDHKERALDFCLRSGKPWAMLLPSYVATKAYFEEALDATATPQSRRPFFVTPHTRYTYDHPEGTGHTESPFYSIWYVGLTANTEAVYDKCSRRADAGAVGVAAAARGVGKPGGAHAGAAADAAGAAGARKWAVSLARSVDDLRQAKAVATAKRLNPKQRARLKRKSGVAA